jgi:tetratricopeptide (TPR) repeat protein
MLVLPWGFTIDPAIPIPPGWLAALAWLGITALVVLAAFRFSRARAGFWFIAGVVLLLPSSSIFPATDLAADRRMYLPMIAFAACAGLLLASVRPVFLAPVFLVLCGLSFVRTTTWRTEESLWTDAVEKAPGKLRPLIQLARAIDPQRGIEILERAKRTAPDEPRIASEEGRIYLAVGRPGDALVEFGRALALAPRNADALNNRGAALLALDQKDAARQDFERALAIDPCEFDARLNLLHLGISKPLPADCKFSPEQMESLRGR